MFHLNKKRKKNILKSTFKILPLLRNIVYESLENRKPTKEKTEMLINISFK
jgi:hypothetical protein